MTDTIGIGTITGRVVVRVGHGTNIVVTEMDLTEAKHVRRLLNAAIERLESGITSQTDLASLISRLR
jgi:hypothetical protein